MTNEVFIGHLNRLRACRAGVRHVGDSDLATFWRESDRGDYMLWLVAAAGIARKIIAVPNCRIVRTVLYFVPDCEDRPRIAIETLERWVRGEATIEEVREASSAASSAVYALSSSNIAVYYAATATARAACAAMPTSTADDASAAVAATAAASSAANAAAIIYAADASANDVYSKAARDDALKEYAAIVRETITAEIIKSALEETGCN